jgi:hypothetical protein
VPTDKTVLVMVGTLRFAHPTDLVRESRDSAFAVFDAPRNDDKPLKRTDRKIAQP